MTLRLLIWTTCVYFAAFIAVVYFTRATARRAIGALIGGAAAGAFFCAVVFVAQRVGWWRSPLPVTTGLLVLFYIASAISWSPIYPITWRVARRFRGPGVGICIIAAAVIGPPRDYLIAALHPEWIVFARGLVPILVVSATYAGVVALGHLVMRYVAGPAQGDRLVQRSREAA